MQKLPLLTLDFETYYESAKYTLKALTYAEYVHHEKFKIHGVGVILNGERQWFTDMDAFRAFLTDIGEDVRMLCHNTMFDGYILHAIFDWHPKVYLDTQGMSRGMFVGQSASLDALTKRLFPDDKTMRKGKELVNTINKYHLTDEELAELGGYCVLNKASDCALTLACYEAMEPHYPDRELELIDLTLQMFCKPLLDLDVPLTEKTLRVKTKLRDRAIKRAKVPESVLSSNPQFQAWIEKQGIEPPMKISLDTGEETFAGGKSDLEFQLMRKSYPQLEHVWAGRIATKSTGEISRAKRFLQVAELNRGKMPVALSYYSAHTGRYGGTQKTNLQNLGRDSKLRQALRAPKGQLVYVADSSNIEARMNNWNAGQDDMVEIFRSGADVYSLFAEENIYHFPIDKHRNKVERFVGKVAVLGLGYGMGAAKFRTTLATGGMGMEVIIEASDAFGVVQAYRVRHNKIVDYWKACDLALAKMLDPQCDEEWGVLHLMHNMIVLPNGMALQYPGLHAEEDKDGRLSFMYHNGKFWKNTWGGTLCISKDTPVLTDRGLVRIQDISIADKVWDGIEWVTHDGLVDKGTAPVIKAHGVTMTPEHKVLTDDGWKTAQESKRHCRAHCELPEGFDLPRLRREKSNLERAMPGLQPGHQNAGHRVYEALQKGRAQLLRLYAGSVPARTANDPWHEQAPGLRRVAQYARSLPTALTSGVQKLWRQGYLSLRPLAAVRGVLGRYGADLPTWANSGPQEQRWALPARQLPVGRSQSPGQQPAELTDDQWRINRNRIHENRHFQVDPALSTSEPVAYGQTADQTQRQEQVYDLLNCGSRNRFTVIDENGQPLIVHNCENIIQALSRIVLFEQMLDINMWTKRFDPKGGACLNVHDEIITVASDFGAIKTDEWDPVKREYRWKNDSEAREYYDGIEKILRTPLDWCPDLPLDCEGGWDYSYSK